MNERNFWPFSALVFFLAIHMNLAHKQGSESTAQHFRPQSSPLLTHGASQQHPDGLCLWCLTWPPGRAGRQQAGGGTHPQQSERVLLPQLLLDLLHGPLQTGDLHAQQGLVLVQTDELPPLLRLQLDLQQLLLLVQELVQVAELGLDTLLQVGRVFLGGWEKNQRSARWTGQTSQTGFQTRGRSMEASALGGGCQHGATYATYAGDLIRFQPCDFQIKKQRSQHGPMIWALWEGLEEFSETCREPLVLVSYLQLSDFLLGLPVTLQRRVEFSPQGLHGAVQRRLPPQTHTVTRSRSTKSHN